MILFLIAYAFATSFAFELFAPSRSYSSSGTPLGNTSMSSVMEGFLEGLLTAYLLTLILTSVTAGIFLKRYMHLNNGILTVLAAQILLTIIAWPILNISSDSAHSVLDFVLGRIYIWVPLLFLYFYIFYAMVLRNAAPKSSSAAAKPSSWYIK